MNGADLARQPHDRNLMDWNLTIRASSRSPHQRRPW
jgi:hypothetical protein